MQEESCPRDELCRMLLHYLYYNCVGSKRRPSNICSEISIFFAVAMDSCHSTNSTCSCMSTITVSVNTFCMSVWTAATRMILWSSSCEEEKNGYIIHERVTWRILFYEVLSGCQKKKNPTDKVGLIYSWYNDNLGISHIREIVVRYGLKCG